jgi:hypothetical protein
LIEEGRSVVMRMGSKEDNQRFLEAAEAYAMRTIDYYEETLRRGVDGIPVPLAP